MLDFNPKTRLTVKEALSSSIFDKIRVPHLEKDAPHKIYLGCDLNSNNNLDLTAEKMKEILQ